MQCGVVALLAAVTASADDWPQWRGPARDGVWRESGIVESLPSQLRFVWRTRIGAGYAGPAIVGRRVYVTDRRMAQRRPPGPPPADRESPSQKQNRRSSTEGVERVLCLDAATGAIQWTHEYPCQYAISYSAGPRATPTVHQGKVYSLGAMGDLCCLDADTGKVLWSKNYLEDFGTRINTWGMSAAPLVDGSNLIALVGGANGAGVVALDLATGTEVWRALDVEDPGYCAPAIFEVGSQRQLIVWTPEAVSALDPATGKVLWEQPFRLQAGLSIPSPVFDPANHRLFVTAFYNGPMMLQLDPGQAAASILWKGKSNSEIETDGLHAIMCTPVLEDGYLFGVCSYGQLRCLEASTGRRIWETRAATGEGRWWNAFLIPHEDRYFICNEQGELIIARLDSKGYHEDSRAFLIAPTNRAQRRQVVWTHPAFANRSIYARNDEEIVCVDLSAGP